MSRAGIMSRWDCDGWLVGWIENEGTAVSEEVAKRERGYICGGERGLRGHTDKTSALKRTCIARGGI